MQEDVMATSTSEMAGWLRGRLPDEWFTGPPEVTIDREEIVVLGRLAAPEGVEGEPEGPEMTEAAHGRISRFREDTRDERIAIAREAEHRFGRKVAWGVDCDGRRALFTHLSVPVMTRLRQPERQVLDTLVEAGVARSRSEALAWAVRLVGQHTEDWLRELREAMETVRRVRETGPEPS
jgi:Arc/MetJ-type ribon-helix-helix transcriptional regulator